MPFVIDDHRAAPNLSVPGDRCYVAYKAMMDEWRRSPRWTIIDSLAKGIWPDDFKRAEALAFLVFMAFHGIPYEAKKRTENGDI